MKKLILSLALMVAFISTLRAQILPVDAKTGKVTFLEVVDATGMSQADLFKETKAWALSKGMTIKSEDEAKGELVFEGKMPMTFNGIKGKPESANVTYTFSIFVKEGKYRYIVTDLFHKGEGSDPSGGKLENVNPECGPGRMTSANWQQIKKKTSTDFNALVADLKRVIKEIQNDPAKKTDW